MARANDATMLNSPESVIALELEDGERLLWSGRPGGGIRFQASDIFAIPFSLMWAGFAVFWEMSVVRSGAPLFFMLWGIPFVLVGLYITVGRFLVDAFLRGKTYYGLTNRRIIISRLFPRRVQSLSLVTLPTLALTRGAGDRGTILFGQTDDSFSFWRRQAPPPPAFEYIDHARQVYEQIDVAQRAAWGPAAPMMSIAQGRPEVPG